MDQDRPQALPSAHPLAHNTNGIFVDSKNIIITGGKFIASAAPQGGSTSKTSGGFELLRNHVATSAFHDSAQRFDPPKCHPHTRKIVLEEILAWVLMQEALIRATWILWLHGAAGAGKTAIAQSIAEICTEKNIHVASFFFFRGDPMRNTTRLLVGTLAYQLIQLISSITDLIIRGLESNPLILIVQPLRFAQLTSRFKLLLVIDGVDECSGFENQMDLIRLISRLLQERDSPFVVLFGSRAESQLKMVFNSTGIANITRQMPLDDHYLPGDDIRLFLNDKFSELKQTHPYGRNVIPDEWPAVETVEELVNKSSGQFIYASVVMKFISFPQSNPTRRLDIVLGLQPSGSLTPFAQLDALYRYIFSRVENIAMTKKILAYRILSKISDIPRIVQFFSLTWGSIFEAMAHLESVITIVDSSSIQLLHASLADFLFDRERSQEYHISSAEWGTEFSLLWLQRPSWINEDYHTCAPFVAFLKHAEITPALHGALLADQRPFKNLSNFRFDSVEYANIYAEYLNVLRVKDFGDGGEVYRHQLKINVPQLCFQSWFKNIEKDHDEIEFADILKEIRTTDNLTGRILPKARKSHDEALFAAKKSQKPNRLHGFIAALRRKPSSH